MTAEQKQCIKNYENEIDILKFKIRAIKDSCHHKNLHEHDYIDYDRNKHTIRCIDCGQTLFDGNIYELKEYRNKNG